MIVVDANIITHRFINGEITEKALRAQQLDPIWVVPLLCKYEFLNVLAKFYRLGILPSQKCSAIWSETESLLRAMEKPVDMDLALSLALRDKITGYDSQYIALAISLGVRCLTEDRELLKKYPKTAISLKEFTSAGLL